MTYLVIWQTVLFQTQLFFTVVLGHSLWYITSSWTSIDKRCRVFPHRADISKQTECHHKKSLMLMWLSELLGHWSSSFWVSRELQLMCLNGWLQLNTVGYLSKLLNILTQSVDNLEAFKRSPLELNCWKFCDFSLYLFLTVSGLGSQSLQFNISGSWIKHW